MSNLILCNVTESQQLKNVERLGTLEDLKYRFGDKDPIGEAKKYVAELTAAEKEANKKVIVEYSPTTFIQKNEQRSYNGGYLFLQKIYHELGLDYICKKIEKKHKNKYDLSKILSMLLYTRVLYPGSKLSSLEDAKRLIEQPSADIHQVYHALSLLATEFNEVQADVYKRSLKLGKRDTRVVYYDLTNYFFEWEEEQGLIQYGHSKEGRPLPIVQMGLFMDKDGFPLAMCIEPGNTAETTTLKPMEELLKEKFGLSKLVVCTDGGLSSYENRKNDSVGDRAFITVQSLKKIKKPLQDWALEATGWHMSGSNEEYDISQLNPDEYYNVTFYKERWKPINMSTGEVLEQRLIVTFSFKYREYLSYVRNRQISRAQALIENFSLNQDIIDQESRFDGFYGICTDLEGSAPEIIGTLRDMNFLSVNGEGYVPTYTRIDLTNNLHGSAGFRTSYRLHVQKNIEATNRHYSGL